MKPLLTTVTLVFAFAFAAASLAAQSESAMQDCFNKHAQLMAKPSEKCAGLLAHTRVFDGKVVGNCRMS